MDERRLNENAKKKKNSRGQSHLALIRQQRCLADAATQLPNRQKGIPSTAKVLEVNRLPFFLRVPKFSGTNFKKRKEVKRAKSSILLICARFVRRKLVSYRNLIWKLLPRGHFICRIVLESPESYPKLFELSSNSLNPPDNFEDPERWNPFYPCPCCCWFRDPNCFRAPSFTQTHPHSFSTRTTGIDFFFLVIFRIKFSLDLRRVMREKQLREQWNRIAFSEIMKPELSFLREQTASIRY